MPGTNDYCDLCEQRFKAGEQCEEYNGIAVHISCVKALVNRFAKPIKSYNYASEKRYMVVRDPDYAAGSPAPKIRFTGDSARHAASNMARREKVPFFVVEIKEVFVPSQFAGGR